MKSLEEAKHLIETGTAQYRRARRQREVDLKAWNEYSESTKRRKTQRLQEALLALEGSSYIDKRNIEEIYCVQQDIDSVVGAYLCEGDAEGEVMAAQCRRKFASFLSFLHLPYPLPSDPYIRMRLWSEVKAKVVKEDADRERLSLIREFGLDEGLSLRRARNAAQKASEKMCEQAEQMRQQAERERLGIAEEVDVNLVSELIDRATQEVSRISPQGFLYFRCWAMPDGTRWYKVGITNDLKRRESEQNVLPVSMETLAVASFSSFEQARAVELALHKVLEAHRIRGAQNRELFGLEPSQVTAVIFAIKRLLGH